MGVKNKVVQREQRPSSHSAEPLAVDPGFTFGTSLQLFTYYKGSIVTHVHTEI